jgi:NADPH:quinone reductase-like Zn-dependent oxidoreductase
MSKPMWIPAPGYILCEEEAYQVNGGGRIIIPVTAKGRESAYRVIAIGEGVTGYEVGDYVAIKKAFKAPSVVFVRAVATATEDSDIVGKVPAASVGDGLFQPQPKRDFSGDGTVTADSLVDDAESTSAPAAG